MKRVAMMLLCVLAACSDRDPMDVPTHNPGGATVPNAGPVYSEVADPNAQVVVFSYPNGSHSAPFSFTVPALVTAITVDAYGAQGTRGDPGVDGKQGADGGLGGRALATLSVTPGEQLTIILGQQVLWADPINAENGGGPGGSTLTADGGSGGGASSVLRGSTVLIIAGGGGGGGACPFGGVGGAGGTKSLDNSTNGLLPGEGAIGTEGLGGWPGSLGGQGGRYTSVGGYFSDGLDGSPGQGGAGGGHVQSFACGGGGGGGGAMGGGGGSSSMAGAVTLNPYGGAGGGGGSSAGPVGTIFQGGVRAGFGEVRISYVVPNVAPIFTTVRPLSPLTVNEGQDIAFEATATDPNHDPLTYSWVFGENNAGQLGASATYAYRDNGNYVAMVSVSDDHDHTTQSSIAITVNNVAPTATFVAPAQVAVGDSWEISLADVKDAAGDLPTLEFAFSCDGTEIGEWSSTPRMTCPPIPSMGERSPRARVRDKDGAISLYRADVQFYNRNRDPVVTSTGGPYSGLEETPMSFNATATDEEGDALTYSWRFGDGTTADGQNVSHTYADPGEYDVLVIVTDAAGNVVTAPTHASIARINHAPTVTSNGGPYQGDEDRVVNFTATATDVDGDNLVYTWSFGDGATAEGAHATHQYGDNGDFTVTLTVADGHGGSATSTTTAEIHNVAPAATFLAPSSIPESATAHLVFSSPIDVPADLPSLEYSFTCDGITWTAYAEQTTHLCPTTRFGVLHVGGRIRDKDGAVTEYSKQVDVQNRPPIVPAFAGAEIMTGEVYGTTSTFGDWGNDSPWTVVADYGDGSAPQTLPYTLVPGHDATFALNHTYRTAGVFTVRVTVTDAGGSSTQNTATVTVLSPQAEVQKLQGAVTALVANGALRTSDANPLQNSLDNVSKHLQNGKKDQALKELDSFIKKVEGMVPSKMSAANAASLIDYAKRLQASIGR